ncbi:AAA family ATPase [Undibacterium flavidum]|uniref:AAA family ATPase n=1 Tax=Undibacterium flavidum TaxID=2762297 RepID=A0ABR6Y9D5_9BURK|nr:AAA family ATPase [Undibacterium flavidum]MBC3873165.1 AAA family ATPase [Undibacterium flavidum]
MATKTNKKTVSEVSKKILNRIQLTSINFSEIPFRKLGSLKINIAPRFTLIAGRNGVGKSTLLGLIANASGITRGQNFTFFGKLPQGNLHEIIHLSMENDYVENEAEKPNVFLAYVANDTPVVKKCNITLRKGSGLRIVPRNEPKTEIVAGDIVIKAAGKVPLPTIYLGMIRMMPVGETEPGTLESSAFTTEHIADAMFIDEFTKRIIHTGSSSEQPEITNQWVKGTKKRSLHPPYAGYDSKGVSLGQDSLSSIATALASFQKIKTSMGNDYPGGLLVIDEIDAGFHPQAQKKLFQELKTEARRLDLQIIATTHSLTLLSEVHFEISKVPQISKREDSIVYLQGGNPVELLDVTEYQKIHDDMFLRFSSEEKKKPIKIYVEDDEAALFLKKILTRTRLNKIQVATNQRIEVLSCHLGCSNLMALHKTDDYFKTVIVVVDGDTESRGIPNVKNIVRLPVDPRLTIKQAPEPIIEGMCQLLVSDQNSYPETRKLLRAKSYTTDHIQEHVLNLQGNEAKPEKTVAADRDHAKTWFNRRLENINNLRLIEGWVADNELNVNLFIDKIVEAVKHIETQIESQKKLAKTSMK